LSPSDLALDGNERASCCTGVDVGRARSATHSRRAGRGIFAIGDVRAGSVKRVAAAGRRGAQVVAAVHAFLAESVEADGCHSAEEPSMD
jgi:thioredoxin reductase (NADPH)